MKRRKCIMCLEGRMAAIAMNGELIIMDRRLLPEGIKPDDEIEIQLKENAPPMPRHKYLALLILRHDETGTRGGTFGHIIQIDKKLLPDGADVGRILHIYVNNKAATQSIRIVEPFRNIIFIYNSNPKD